MEALLAEQQKLGAQIERLLSNYKKDGPSRRTSSYLEKRMATLKELWDSFEKNSSLLEEFEDLLKEHPYIVNQYGIMVKNCYEKFMQIMVEAHQEVNQNNDIETEDEKLAQQDGNFTFTGELEDLDKMPTPTARSSTHPIAQNSKERETKNLITTKVRAQRASMQQLTHMLNRVRAKLAEPQSSDYYDVMRDTITNLFNKLCENHQVIFELTEDMAPLDYNENIFFGMQDYVEETIILLTEGKSKLDLCPIIDNSHKGQLKLPQVTLPKFNGSYLNWMEFKNLFLEVVDRQQIGAAQKMWYLKSNLSGEPETLIKHLPISENNYEAAWQTIQQRYDNKRLLATSLLEKLLQQPFQQTESATALKNLHDVTRECLLGLKGLNIEVNTWDVMLTHLLLKKLDRTSHSLFETSLQAPREIPTVEELLKFIELRFQALESLGKPKTTNTVQRTSISRNYRTTSLVTNTNDFSCVICKGRHPLYSCNNFLHLSNSDKWTKIKTHKLCCNCLRSGHFASSCSSRCCLKCQKKHHTILHVDGKETTVNKPNCSNDNNNSYNSKKGMAIVTNLSTQRNASNNYVFLGTAIIHVETLNGETLECRALLDSGSQVNIITEDLQRKTGIKGYAQELNLIGIGAKQSETTRRVILKIKSKINNYSTYIEALTLPKITTKQPTQFINKDNWNIPSNIKLADENFNKPRAIDILIGAEIYSDLMCIGQIRSQKDLPTLQKTQFGWIVLGRAPIGTTSEAFCGISTADLSYQVQKFWELEEISNPADKITTKESQCEQFFELTTFRNAEGRFVVRLPFAEDTTRLGNSRIIAEIRFKNLEKRLSKSAELKAEYTKFLKEYLELGHMKKVLWKDIPNDHYFLPHHAVIKPDSSTTKLRVVFDASAKTSTNVSLNNLLMTGPSIQDDIFSILLRFRFPKYVFSADIAKMYRQILINDKDTHHQLILWRDNPADDLQAFKLLTVTYGTTAAPYLAIKCLQRLAHDELKNYPLAAQATLTDFYVDDIMTGCDDLKTTRETQKQLIAMLSKAGFLLRKWCANHPKLLEAIPLDHREVKCNLSEDTTVKTLGMIWNPVVDEFMLQTTWPSRQKVTKRSILAELSQVYDPLGLINPIIVTAKIIMSELWQLKLDWDEAVPQLMHTKWLSFQGQMPLLQKFKAPRRVVIDAYKHIQIHGFADASQRAYGAAVYIRSMNEQGDTAVHLLCAKSRVAPIKTITIARLELCAAKLLACLVKRIQQSLKLQIDDIFYWSDSTIVLSWIGVTISPRDVFLANRIATIQRLSSPKQWNHVPTKQNPADFISRGVFPEELLNSKLWFNGPSFLKQRQDQWADQISEKHPHEETGVETTITLISSTACPRFENILRTIDHRNSFGYLHRSTAFILRFGYNCKPTTIHQKKTQFPDTLELNAAMMFIFRMSQRETFSEELLQLQQKKTVKNNSKLKKLAPFLDGTGLIRVGGRLQASSLSYDAKHPIILCNKHPHTKLLIEKLHWDNLHAGPQALLAITRQKVWPLQGRKLVQSICHGCFRCFLTKPRAIFQMMGNLPADRVEPARPFIHVGIDFAGPIQIHYKLRGKRPTKAYIAVFVCFTTKAIHLELVSDLTTAAFIGALKRFVGRRGHPSKIYCDNATNFIGAKANLQELQTLFMTQDHKNKVLKTCAEEGIQWLTIPPRSPHFGGLWEAAVKAAKYHLRRIINAASVTYEELDTIIVQIEAVLNSRPITQLSNDPNDLQALTPGHFLIGAPLTALIEPNQSERNINVLKRWEIVQAIHQEFWKRWSKEYLQELQQRAKWFTQNDNIKVDTLVLIKDDNLPPLQWQLGRIQTIIKGEDGLIRVADVKTSKGTYRRAIQNLCPLPIKDNDDDENYQQQMPKPAVQTSLIITKQPRKKIRIFAGHSCWTDPKVSNSTNPSSCSSAAYITKVILIAMLILPLTAAPIDKQVDIQSFASQSGIYFENLGSMTIINEEWNIIIYYELQGYWNELKNMNQYINRLTQMCSHFGNSTSYCNHFVGLLGHQIIKLNHYNKIFTSNKIQRNKRSPFDIVGTLANKLFGVLDQDYAQQLENTIQTVKSNEKHLLDLIKNQTSVLDSTANILTKSEIYINTQFSLIKEHIDTLQTNIIKKISLQDELQEFDSLVLQFTLIVNSYQHTQNNIIDLLVDTHHGHINPFLLTPEQLTNELHRIREHLPPNSKLPYEQNKLEELYQLITVKGCVTQQHLIMTIRIPLVSIEPFELYSVIPMPIMQAQTVAFIDISIQYMIIDLHRTYFYSITDLELLKCHQSQEKGYFCQPKHPVFTRESAGFLCELALFQRDIQNLRWCTFKIVPLRTTVWWHQLSHLNQWLFFAKNNTELNIVCGRSAIQKSITGSGLLTLKDSCIIRQESMVIQSYAVKEMKTELSLIPNMNITKLVPISSNSLRFIDYNLTTLNQTAEIEKIHQTLKTIQDEEYLSNHDIHHYTISYTFVAVVIGIIIFIFYRRKQTNVTTAVERKPFEFHTSLPELRSYKNSAQKASQRGENV